jgi:hypothetical protein
MRRSCLLLLVAAGCNLSQSSSDALGEAAVRALFCSASSGACHPQPPEVDFFLRGSVRAGNTYATPVSYAKLNLIRGGRVVDSTTTDERGRFSFRGDFPEDSYEILLVASNYIGGVTLFVTCRTADVIVFASRSRT